MSSEESIRATIDQLTEAWNANDMGTFLSLFTADANYISGAGVWLRGREAIREQFSNNDKTQSAHEKVIITESMIKLIKSDVAVVHSRWKMTVTGDQKGEQLPLRSGIFTMVIMSEGAKWRIAALQNTDVREE